jgi:hypothetical protein
MASFITSKGVPMTKTRQIPLGNYPSGSYPFGPWAFTQGLDGFDIRLGRCTAATPLLWPLTTTRVRIDMQFSYDGGETFTEIGANSWEGGGGVVSKNGVDIAETSVSWNFAPNEPTHAKATVTVINGPVRTYVDVTIVT